jgi:hypothetical protein
MGPAFYAYPPTPVHLIYRWASIAIVNNAEYIYSEDPDLPKFGDSYIDILKITIIHEQGDIFGSNN